MRWERDSSGGGVLCCSPTPDQVQARNEELAWAMSNGQPFHLANGNLISGRRSQIAEALRQMYSVGERQWKPKLRELAERGRFDPRLLTATKGEFEGLSAEPLEGEIGYTVAATGDTLMLSAANAGLYLPIPARSLTGGQGFRYMIGGRLTTVATAVTSILPAVRLGNSTAGIACPGVAAVTLWNKPATAFTALGWWLEGRYTCYRTGPPGTNALMAGIVQMQVNTAVGGAYSSIMWNPATAGGVAFDSTVGPNSSTNGGQISPSLNYGTSAADVWTFQHIHLTSLN